MAVSEAKRMAVIESAQACGLYLLRKEEQNPMRTSTFGVGMLIRVEFVFYVFLFLLLFPHC